MADEHYTAITDAEMRALVEAGAGGREIAAYHQLTRHYNDPEHPARCWVSASLAAERLGITQNAFRKALARLCERRFTIGGGVTLPVLTRVSGGHNGRAAVYNNNIRSAIVGGRLVPPTRQFSTTE